MSRNYCLTFFTEPTIWLPEGVKYAIYGIEICPTTNKKHWQSYIELSKTYKMGSIKKLYNDKTIHIESRKGTREQARDYCTKDKDYLEYGRWSKGQGERTDLQVIVDELQSGTTLDIIMVEKPDIYCRYRNGLKDISATILKNSIPPWRTVIVTLYTGPTGCGKTRRCMELEPYKIEGSNLSWFQDYQGEKILLIDEYNNDVNTTLLLNLLDGYPLRLNVKGSHTYANWTEVHITTNLKISELHNNARSSHRKALFRRITHIINYWDDPRGVTMSMGDEVLPG